MEEEFPFEAIVIAATLYSASARTLHARITPLANNLGTAATTVTYLVQFLHLGVLPTDGVVFNA